MLEERPIYLYYSFVFQLFKEMIRFLIIFEGRRIISVYS